MCVGIRGRVSAWLLVVRGTSRWPASKIVCGKKVLLGWRLFVVQGFNRQESDACVRVQAAFVSSVVVRKLVCSYLVDPASSHMLVSKIKPCMSKYKHSYCETANGSLNQLWFI